MGSRYNMVISFINKDPIDGVTRIENCDFDFIAERRMIYINLFKGYTVSNILNLKITRIR